MTVGPVERDAATAAWFDATAQGRFLLRRCPACGAWASPRAAQCPVCASTELRWEPSSGRARLVSWSVTHARPRPAAEGAGAPDATTVVGIVELDEGVWWWAQLRVADPAALAVGAALTVAFERSAGDAEAVPVFTAP